MCVAVEAGPLFVLSTGSLLWSYGDCPRSRPIISRVDGLGLLAVIRIAWGILGWWCYIVYTPSCSFSLACQREHEGGSFRLAS